MTRPVYLAAGEMLSSRGRGIEGAAAACLAQRCDPGTVSLPYLADQIELPYYKAPGNTESVRHVLADIGGAALEAARVDAGQRARTALLIGSSSLDVNLHEQEYIRAFSERPDAIPLKNPDQGFVAESLAADLGLGGPRYTLLTACSAAGNALLYAAWMIRHGVVDRALVIGTEVFNRISILGFHSMLLLSKTGSCRPFDAQRDGIVLGEAVAAVVLTSERGNAKWQLRGGATLCDTAQPTNSVPEKIAEVIAGALLDAGCGVGDVACIKAHGTATGANDLSEGVGIKSVFGSATPPVTAIKPVFGHTLGACGAVETLALLACLDAGQIPAIANHAQTDPDVAISPLIRNSRYAGGPVLLNYFGFGGNNCALIFDRA
jgi:3-oxoacyl-[acyl-carrier-protein] synthase-1